MSLDLRLLIFAKEYAYEHLESVKIQNLYL